MAMALPKRIVKETERLMAEPVKGINAVPHEDNLRYFDVQIWGPPGSPYDGGVFKLELFLPDEYPMTPPKIRFLTKIYHPNIDRLGRICLDVLKNTDSSFVYSSFTGSPQSGRSSSERRSPTLEGERGSSNPESTPVDSRICSPSIVEQPVATDHEQAAGDIGSSGQSTFIGEQVSGDDEAASAYDQGSGDQSTIIGEQVSGDDEAAAADGQGSGDQSTTNSGHVSGDEAAAVDDQDSSDQSTIIDEQVSSEDEAAVAESLTSAEQEIFAEPVAVDEHVSENESLLLDAHVSVNEHVSNNESWLPDAHVSTNENVDAITQLALSPNLATLSPFDMPTILMNPIIALDGPTVEQYHQLVLAHVSFRRDQLISRFEMPMSALNPEELAEEEQEQQLDQEQEQWIQQVSEAEFEHYFNSDSDSDFDPHGYEADSESI